MDEPRTQKSARGGRKARASFDDGDKQRERKRAMDRIAQKMSREKTKSRIAQLENMVAILEAKSESHATHQLMAEVARQNQEIERLRKIIASISSILRNEVFDHIPAGKIQEQGSPSSDEHQEHVAQEHKQHREEDFFLIGRTVPAGETDQGMTGAEAEDDLDINYELPEMTVSPDLRMRQNSLDFTTRTSYEDILDFGSSWQRGHVAISGYENEVSAAGQLLGSWNSILTPIPRAMPRESQNMSCKVWQRSNHIYAKLFNISPTSALNARNSNAGSLIKAVKNGWASLNIEEQNNPALQILREVDQEIFPELDPVTRVANLYKSHQLLKYYLNAEAGNWGSLPVWQRPLPSQSAKQHPIAVDFFAWPALRERLIQDHYKYFTTTHFSNLYRKNLRFSWPFSFEDTYTYCEETDTYHFCPLFERYHRDLKYWGVEKAFFQQFPELADAIPMPLEDSNQQSSILSAVQLPYELSYGTNDVYEESTNRVKTPSSFSDPFLMDVFCDLPRVA